MELKKLNSMISLFFSRLLILLVKIYQKIISPLLPKTCRFYPTCSHYAVEAIQTHGPRRGSFLAVKRILRCHPLNPGGWDPVPPKIDHQE